MACVGHATGLGSIRATTKTVKISLKKIASFQTLSLENVTKCVLSKREKKSCCCMFLSCIKHGIIWFPIVAMHWTSKKYTCSKHQ